MTKEQIEIWNEIVKDCNSGLRSVNVASKKRRGVINAVNEALGLALIMESVCSCSKGKGIDHDEDGKAYCIDCGNYLEQIVP